MKAWARAIVDVYTQVIVPTWENKKKKTQMNSKLASMVTETPLNTINLIHLGSEFLAADKKSWQDRELKKQVF